MHVVLLDFSQDMTLGREEVGKSRTTSAPIRHGWSLNQCPVLLDSGACVPMPFLISAEALERSCPILHIMPIDRNDATPLSAANDSALQLVGSIILHFGFSGSSVVSAQDGKEAVQGLVMQYWYPACAAVFQNLSTLY